MSKSQLLTGSINVSRIPKEKLIRGKKTKEFYLPVAVWLNEEPDQYGNHASIQVGLSKEEREAGADKTFIGNLKNHKPAGPQRITDEEAGNLPF